VTCRKVYPIVLGDDNGCCRSSTPLRWATIPAMVLIEMPNGARATLRNGEWTSSTLGLANLLNRLMPEHSPGPKEGDLEHTCADHVARKVSARILAHTSSNGDVPRRVG
jgi:hypothetical protein